MAVQSIQIPKSLAYVLNRAGDKSGVDFDYLVQTAMRESSLNPKAKAQTSSATGLFQFIEGTWLDVMKSDGGRLGYQRYADAIVRDANGDYTVRDERLRADILKLREDPQIAADLAAAFTKRNGDYLSEKFGRMPSPGELYIAHFLGAQGAEKLFQAGLQNPDQLAVNLFPRQAAANRAIFYEGGEPRTIRQVYKALVAKHAPQPDGATAFAAQQIAADAAQGVKRTPLHVSFDGLFATEDNQPRSSPLQRPNAAGGSLFTRFYGKK